MLNRDPRQLPACACCGSPATFACWGVGLCSVCHGAWWTDPRFDAAAIDKAVGARDWHLEQVLTGVGEAEREAERQRYAAEATRRTRAWVVEQRKARAA